MASSSRKESTTSSSSKLPVLSSKVGASSPKMIAMARMNGHHNGLVEAGVTPLPSSLPSLPSSPLVGGGDNRSLLSRTSSKRSRLKSQLSHTSPLLATDNGGDEERRTSSDPGARRGGGASTRHPSVISANGGEQQSASSDASDLGRSISIGGKSVPTAAFVANPQSESPSPSTPAPTRAAGGSNRRQRSNSVFVAAASRPGPGSSEDGMRRSRNGGSSSELGRKDGIYEGQSLSDDTKRSSRPLVNSVGALRGETGKGVGGVGSPGWAGQLTHAVLELSQEIHRLRGQAAVRGVQGQPATGPTDGSTAGGTADGNRSKSTSLFWNQAALQNASSLRI